LGDIHLLKWLHILRCHGIGLCDQIFKPMGNMVQLNKLVHCSKA
jgi:hypothetical protein